MFTKEEEKEILTNLGKEVKRLRLKKGWSQFKLSTEAEIPKNQVGRIERAEINTTIITLHKLIKTLEINIEDLFNK